MSLTIGDLKEEEAWRPVIQWMRALTKRRIGVLWINHTGHDKSRSYGTSTREWQLDNVMIAEKVEDADADIAMKLSFTKIFAADATPKSSRMMAVGRCAIWRAGMERASAAN